MKFKTKIIISYMSILVSIILLTAVVVIMSNTSQSDAEFLQTRVSVSLSEAKQLKLDIVQIQQSLTDVSASGNTSGFDMAEEYFKDANRLLDKDIERKNKLGRVDLEKQLKGIKVQLQDYYNLGKKMAHVYIEDGRDAGNVWMDKFDPEVEKLSALIEKQVSMYEEVDESKSLELIGFLGFIKKTTFLVSLILLIIVITMSILITVSFTKGVKLVSNYSDKLSANDIRDSLSIKRKDEFGKTALQFKNSFKLLNKLVSGIKSSTDTTANVKDSLAASAEETSATIVNIKNSTTSLSEESEKLNKTVTDNVTVIEEITANIGSINNQIGEQAAMVEESTASITEMISSLDSVNTVTIKKKDSINSLVEVVGTGSSTLSEMAEGFKTNVVNKIEGISEMASTIQ